MYYMNELYNMQKLYITYIVNVNEYKINRFK